MRPAAPWDRSAQLAQSVAREPGRSVEPGSARGGDRSVRLGLRLERDPVDGNGLLDAVSGRAGSTLGAGAGTDETGGASGKMSPAVASVVSATAGGMSTADGTTLSTTGGASCRTVAGGLMRERSA